MWKWSNLLLKTSVWGRCWFAIAICSSWTWVWWTVNWSCFCFVQVWTWFHLATTGRSRYFWRHFFFTLFLLFTVCFILGKTCKFNTKTDTSSVKLKENQICRKIKTNTGLTLVWSCPNSLSWSIHWKTSWAYIWAKSRATDLVLKKEEENFRVRLAAYEVFFPKKVSSSFITHIWYIHSVGGGTCHHEIWK